MPDGDSSSEIIENKLLLVYRNQPHGFIFMAEKAVREKGWYTRIRDLSSFEVQTCEYSVLLADIERPLPASLTETKPRLLQQIFSSISCIL